MFIFFLLFWKQWPSYVKNIVLTFQDYKGFKADFGMFSTGKPYIELFFF